MTGDLSKVVVCLPCMGMVALSLISGASDRDRCNKCAIRLGYEAEARCVSSMANNLSV